MTCHNGGTLLSPAAPNVMAEIAKVGHPLPAGNNFHDAAEKAVLNNNRHATCVDCHSAHGSNQVITFPTPPAIRPSQAERDRDQCQRRGDRCASRPQSV